ncbi:MAG: hypothetical protein CMK59_12655 [Proteobacteria bacterium]|nr:hypothetical protein [Pseudomonadota bacterium]
MNAALIEQPLAIEQLIESISNEQLRHKIKVLHRHSIEHWGFNTQPASVRYHHFWEGGYRSHVGEVMNIAVQLFEDVQSRYFSKENPMSCSRDDVVVAAYIHDLYKLTRYRRIESSEADGSNGAQNEEQKPIFEFIKKPRIEDTALVVSRCVKGAGYVPSELILHAVTMHHGGWSDVQASVYSYGDRLEGLAAILAAADMISGFMLGRR